MDKRQKAIKILKIAGTIIYAATTAFLIIMFVAFLPDYIAQEKLWELGGIVMLIVTLSASIAYIVPIALGGVGAVISSKIQDRKSKIYFTFMIFVPIATAVANFVTYLILLKT